MPCPEAYLPHEGRKKRKADKAAVTELLSSIDGLRVVDAGRLEMSRMVEGLTPILIGINIRNKVHSGFRITGLD